MIGLEMKEVGFYVPLHSYPATCAAAVAVEAMEIMEAQLVVNVRPYTIPTKSLSVLCAINVSLLRQCLMLMSRVTYAVNILQGSLTAMGLGVAAEGESPHRSGSSKTGLRVTSEMRGT